MRLEDRFSTEDAWHLVALTVTADRFYWMSLGLIVVLADEDKYRATYYQRKRK